MPRLSYWLLLLIVLGAPVFLPPPAGATTPAAPTTDLCEIPFTEAHRAAIEHRHLPALREILEHWVERAAHESAFGETYKPWFELRFRTLLFLKARIKTAKTVPLPSERGRVTMPPRDGPALNVNDVLSRIGREPFVLDPKRQDAIHKGSQALLHWACQTSDANLFNRMVLFALEVRGDYGASPRLYSMTFEDWRQLSAITYHKMNAFPAPSSSQLQEIVNLPGILIVDVFNPIWMKDHRKVDIRWRFQFDVTDWIMSSTAEFPFKIEMIIRTTIRYWSEDPADLARPQIVKRVLRYYRDIFLPKRLTNEVSAGVWQDGLERLLSLMINTNQYLIAGCFHNMLLDYPNRTDQISNHPPADRPYENAAARFDRSMRDEFGSGWKNFLTIPSS